MLSEKASHACAELSASLEKAEPRPELGFGILLAGGVLAHDHELGATAFYESRQAAQSALENDMPGWLRASVGPEVVPVERRVENGEERFEVVREPPSPEECFTPEDLEVLRNLLPELDEGIERPVRVHMQPLDAAELVAVRKAVKLVVDMGGGSR